MDYKCHQLQSKQGRFYLLSTHPDIKTITYNKEIVLISKEEMSDINEVQSFLMDDIIGRDMNLTVTLVNQRNEATPATAVVTGRAALAINDKNISNKLTVNGGVKLTVSSYFFNSNADAFLINDGAEIFQDNDNVAASFKMFIDNPTSWGYDHNGGWQYISSPVKNTPISDFDPKTTDYDIFKYDGTQELEWINYKNHATDFETTFQQGRGYIVSYEAETSAIFKGILNHEKTFTFKDVKAFDAGDHFNNFYLLGNPFSFNMEWKR